MSWWKKALRAIGVGAEVAGEVVSVTSPGSRLGRALDKGGEALNHKITESEKKEKAKKAAEEADEHPID